MPSRVVIVGSSVGLHAKPAGMIAAAVHSAGFPVTLAALGEPATEAVDAGNPLMIMTLGAERGDVVRVDCDDPTTLAQICSMIAADLTVMDLRATEPA